MQGETGRTLLYLTDVLPGVWMPGSHGKYRKKNHKIVGFSLADGKKNLKRPESRILWHTDDLRSPKISFIQGGSIAGYKLVMTTHKQNRARSETRHWAQIQPHFQPISFLFRRVAGKLLKLHSSRQDSSESSKGIPPHFPERISWGGNRFACHLSLQVVLPIPPERCRTIGAESGRPSDPDWL
jgi:hypothetical protein